MTEPQDDARMDWKLQQATTALMFSFSGLASSYIKVYQTRGAQQK